MLVVIESRSVLSGHGLWWARLATISLWLLVLCLLKAPAVYADLYYRNPTSLNDYGGVGLLQNPSARFGDDGDIAVGASMVSPNNRFFFTIQALPWLEGTLRYTEITNRLYGPESFSGDQTYKDRGIDAKIRLLEESKYIPQLAVGIRDIGGTRLFGSEYLVASKRYYNWDLTLGLGWGYLGNRGQLDNPLTSLSDRFKGDRKRRTIREAGSFRGDLFKGDRVSIFGGVEWKTPIEGLRAKIEYDGNDYESEPLGNNHDVASPFNFGVTYRALKWLDLSVGVERGNTVMAQLVVRSNLHRDRGVPKFDRAPVPVRIRTRTGKQYSAEASDVSVTTAEETGRETGKATHEKETEDHKPAYKLIKALEKREFTVEAVELSEKSATAYLSQRKYRELPRAVGRASRIIANNVPSEVEEITVVNMEGGLETGRTSIIRRDLENAVSYTGSLEEIWGNAELTVTDGRMAEDAVDNPEVYPAFSWSVQPSLRQHIGGPDDFYFWQLWAKLKGELKILRGLSLSGVAGFNLANNLEGLRLESNSELPHVRSDIKDYLKEGENNLVRLELDYLWKPASNWYARVSAGLFEEMYGGVGGEFLYRRYGSRWAVGMDLNWVRQRDYDQLFDFRDYDVVTGHGTFYYELPFYNLLASVSAGRYLAKDKGVTFNLSRRFDNGVRIGAFATKTNVSAAEFGEGSFDKGVYISLPLDLFFTKSRRRFASFAWRPLTRDGGQRVGVGKRLYGYTVSSSPGAMGRDRRRLLD